MFLLTAAWKLPSWGNKDVSTTPVVSEQGTDVYSYGPLEPEIVILKTTDEWSVSFVDLYIFACSIIN